MQKLYYTQDKVLIYLLQAKLNEKGITCLIKNMDPPLAGEIPPIIAWPEIWVMEDNRFSEATQILANELNSTSQTQDKWRCAKCGENIDGQFNLCWRCNTSR